MLSNPNKDYADDFEDPSKLKYVFNQPKSTQANT
jgi:hypothetical protein